MLTNFGAASVVLFGPPEGFGGDVMFRVGYNTNAADPAAPSRSAAITAGPMTIARWREASPRRRSNPGPADLRSDHGRLSVRDGPVAINVIGMGLFIAFG